MRVRMRDMFDIYIYIYVYIHVSLYRYMMLFPLLYGSLWYVLIYPGFWICEYPSFNVLSLACPKRLIVQGTISFWGKSSGTVCSAKRKKRGEQPSSQFGDVHKQLVCKPWKQPSL